MLLRVLIPVLLLDTAQEIFGVSSASLSRVAETLPYSCVLANVMYTFAVSLWYM